jgi:predicted PolB exonuclease-like 3'-5' exonuclease
MKQLENLNENDLVFYDIETARAVDVLEEGTPLHDAWKYKARYQNELNKKTGEVFTIEDYFYEKAPLYAPFGRVVTIVVGRIKDNKIHLKSYASYDEKELLEEFNRDLEAVYKSNPNIKMVGFNSNGFDSPFLLKRSVINGVMPATPLDEGTSKPWELKAIDLSKVWQGSAFYPDSLISVATALGLPSPKDALDGSQVSTAFYGGQLDEIVKYCLKDVETTTRIYRKLAFLGDLEDSFELIGGKVEVEELPLLQKIYTNKVITIKDKQKLEEILKKNKLSKKEKDIVLDLVKASLAEIDSNFGKVTNQKQIDEIINQLKEEFESN